MAQPEFQLLAYRMLRAWVDSTPERLEWNEWHIPFDEPEIEDMHIRLKVATGRIARVSYLTHDGQRDPSKDVELHEKLMEGEPPHMSPFEHCCQAKRDRLADRYAGNFGRHWLQYRKTIPKEFTQKFDAVATLEATPDWIKNLNAIRTAKRLSIVNCCERKMDYDEALDQLKCSACGKVLAY